MQLWGYIVIGIAVVLFLYLSFGLIYCYKGKQMIFGSRGKDPSHPCYLLPDDFPDLERREYQFEFEPNTYIRGFIYSQKGVSPEKGFIILSHGLFGSHLQYIIDINYLTQAGYEVLAYDQYGVSLSDGASQVSLSQGIYVLDAVLKDVQKRNVHQGKPLLLYGHSWGAYCGLGVLGKHPEIQKAVLRSGPVKPLTAYAYLVKLQTPKMHAFLYPILKFCFYCLNGKKHSLNAGKYIKKNQTTKILVLSAKDDQMVNPKNQQTLYFTNHPQSNVNVFITEKGLHNSIITEESYAKFLAKVKEYKEIMKLTDETEKVRQLESFLSQLDRASMIIYNDEVKEKILSFLD